MARPLIYTLGWFHRPTNKRLPKNTWLRSDRPPRDPPILRLPAGSQTSSSCSSSKFGLFPICLSVWFCFSRACENAGEAIGSGRGRGGSSLWSCSRSVFTYRPLSPGGNRGRRTPLLSLACTAQPGQLISVRGYSALHHFVMNMKGNPNATCCVFYP